MYKRLSLALTLLLIALLALLSYSFYRNALNQSSLTDAYRQHQDTYILASLMRLSSDNLTRTARVYSVTGEPRFKEQFLEILAIRGGVSERPEHYDWVYWDYLAPSRSEAVRGSSVPRSYVELVKNAPFTDAERQLLNQSQRKSDALVELEMGVMDQIDGPTTDTRLLPLFDESYHLAKREILSDVDQVWQSLFMRSNQLIEQAADQASWNHRLGTLTFAALLAVFCCWVLTLYIARKERIAELNSRIATRTAHLKETSEKLSDALVEIKTLQGLLPICSYCHKIRNEDQVWDSLEEYITRHSDAEFSHGICPSCLEVKMADVKRGCDT